MPRYFKKEMLSNRLFLPNGRLVPWIRLPNDVGIIATDDAAVAEELAKAATRRRGGITEITPTDYETLSPYRCPVGATVGQPKSKRGRVMVPTPFLPPKEAVRPRPPIARERRPIAQQQVRSVLHDVPAVPLTALAPQPLRRGDPIPKASDHSVTISIACHNRLDCTRSCIDSIFRHTTDFDLIVTDNDSTDGTGKYLDALAKQMLNNVRIVTNAQNLGFIIPHNHALTMASGSFFAVLNNDVVVGPGWLDEVFKSFDANPYLAICGHNRGCRSLRDTFHGYAGPQIEYVEGSCLIIPTALARQHGLFSDYVTFAYGEDSDLSLRMREAGYDIALIPMPIVHTGGATLKTIKDRQRISRIAADNHRVLQERWRVYLRQRNFNYRVLINREASAGDVLFLTPIVRAIRRQWPNCEISIRTQFPQIFARNPDVFIATQTPLKADAFDVSYDLDLAYESLPTTHVIDAYAQKCGVKHFERKLHMFAGEDCEMFARDRIGSWDWVAIHAGPTAWPGRNWPRERFSAIIQRLKTQGFKVLITGGRQDWDFPEADLHVNGKTSAHELYATLKCCRLFFGIDSFPFHVAQAAGIPVIGLFGTIDPQYRLMNNGTAIGLCASVHDVPCVGEHHRLPPPVTFSTCDGACMRAITIEMAWNAIEELQRSI